MAYNHTLHREIVERWGTQEAFARHLRQYHDTNIDKSELSKIIRGRQHPSAQRRTLIAEALHMHPWEVFDAR